MAMNTFIMVVTITPLLYIMDLVSQYLYVHVGPGDNVIPHNARWFFIHALTNGMIALLGSKDLLYCVKNISTCALEGWTDISFATFMVAFILHLYHVVFFWEKLSVDEWFHHGIMIGLSAPLSLYYQSRATIVALCFLTGYPGMIDYFLLWCVKMRWLTRNKERMYNALINVWIRSPGCLFASFLSIPILFNGIWVESIAPVTMALLSFWNGQYYMVKSLRRKKLK
jgi:hypothetical protein